MGAIDRHIRGKKCSLANRLGQGRGPDILAQLLVLNSEGVMLVMIDFVLQTVNVMWRQPIILVLVFMVSGVTGGIINYYYNVRINQNLVTFQTSFIGGFRGL